MTRHLITDRTAVQPGVIRSICTCGTVLELPAADIDAAVMAHLGGPHDCQTSAHYVGRYMGHIWFTCGVEIISRDPHEAAALALAHIGPDHAEAAYYEIRTRVNPCDAAMADFLAFAVDPAVNAETSDPAGAIFIGNAERERDHADLLPRWES